MGQTKTNGFLARSANFSKAKTKTTQGAQNGKDKGIYNVKACRFALFAV
jgi:hypothetical protein